MLTKEQKEWLAHLSDTEKIGIVPYDPEVKNVFKKIKRELQNVLGKANISHRGSTALKIAGQGEIDLYIPVSKKLFNSYLDKLIGFLGKPGSVYPLKRVRFIKYINGIKIEIFLINKNDEGWKNGIKFEKYLKENPKYLKEYEILKRKANGLSVREYYTLKVEFINYILGRKNI